LKLEESVESTKFEFGAANIATLMVYYERIQNSF